MCSEGMEVDQWFVSWVGIGIRNEIRKKLQTQNH